MAFTKNDDINIIQKADTENMGAGVGNDIYVIGMPESLLRQGQEVSITDATGNNTLRLTYGLTITSGVLGKTYVTLKFSNDSTITLLGADKNFDFGVGGDSFGRGEIKYNFSEFVTNVLGKTIPQSGHLDIGKIIINDITHNISIPVGSVLEYKATANSADKYSFDVDSALKAGNDDAGMNIVTQPSISGFAKAEDSLSFDFATADPTIKTLDKLEGYQGVIVQESPKGTVINFGNDNMGNGDVVTLTLLGITPADWSAINISAI